MRLRLSLALATLLLVGVTVPAWGTLGDLPGVPGQLADDGPLAPTPLCQTEEGDLETPSNDGPELRVGTYNVLHTQDPDGNPTAPQRIGMLADAIEQSGADALGLQEVAKSANLAELDADDDGVDGLMVELIAQRLASTSSDDWSWCWFASNVHVPLEPEPNPGGGGGPLTELATFGGGQQTGNGSEFREGVAILSRYPITSPTVKRLSLRTHEAAFCEDVDPLNCQFAVAFDSRVIMHGVIDAPSGPVDLYTTHLAHGVTSQSDDTKARQISEGLEHIGATEDPTTPTFFVGDFNTDATVEPDADRYAAILAAGFTDSYVAAAALDEGDPLGTSSQNVVSHELEVDHTIDYVFVKRLGCGATYGDIIGDTKAERTDAAGFVWPSDHMGVVTTFGCGTS